MFLLFMGFPGFGVMLCRGGPCGRPQPMWTHWEILAIGLSGVLTATVAAPAKHTMRIDFIG